MTCRPQSWALTWINVPQHTPCPELPTPEPQPRYEGPDFLVFSQPPPKPRLDTQWTDSWCSFPPHHPTPIIQINIRGKYPTKPHPTAIAQHGDLCTERPAAGQSPSLSPSSHSPPSTCAAAVKHADRSASEPLELWPQVHVALAFPAGQMMPIRTSGSSENTLLHQSRQECAVKATHSTAPDQRENSKQNEPSHRRGQPGTIGVVVHGFVIPGDLSVIRDKKRNTAHAL